MAGTTDFDGYHKWLRITNRRRPPSHYDLLGIHLNEDDLEVIQSAAEQRRRYVESKRGIGRDDLVSELLMGIDEAEITLLNVDLRREYDRQLQLFEKRRKSRQVDPNATRSGFESKPSRTVGEDNGIVRTYVGIVAALCTAFAGMALFAFNFLPGSEPVSQNAPALVAVQHAGPAQVFAPQQPAIVPPIQDQHVPPAAPVVLPQERPNQVDVTTNQDSSDLRRGDRNGFEESKTHEQFDLAKATFFEGHYYQVFCELTSWKRAKTRCESMGGHLATISNAAENDFVRTLAEKTIGDFTNTGVWLGATDDRLEGQWEWVDQTPFTYFSWGKGQPNNGGGKHGGENYLLLLLQYRGTDGTKHRGWCDQPVESTVHTAYFVCEWDTKTAAKQPGAVINSSTSQSQERENFAEPSLFEGHYYQVVRELMSWKDAQARCKEIGGHLATISNSAEHEFIRCLAEKTIGDFTNTGVWLGATDEQKEGQWKWVDGTPFGYSAWFEGQPNNGGGKDGGENYLFLLLQFRGGDGREWRGWCDQRSESTLHTAYFACEWEMDPRHSREIQTRGKDELANSFSQLRPKFVPPKSKCLLIVGQDKAGIDSYVREIGHRPAGVMTYDHISSLGLDEATALRREYPRAIMQIGLDFKGGLKMIPSGRFDLNIEKLANWALANPGPIYLRPGYECDGAHNQYPPDEYVKAFRYLRDKLDRLGVRNISYVWHVLPGNHPIEKWWPGDRYVDWVAMTYFAAQKQNMASISAFAKKHNKPLMLAEAAPRGIGTLKGKQSWDAWFRPCFEDIEQYDVRALCYINWDWESKQMFRGGGWGDTRIEQNEFVKRNWRTEISKVKYIKGTPEQTTGRK